jgi:hypothetical protein
MLPLLRITMMESRKSWGKRVGCASTYTTNTMQKAFRAEVDFEEKHGVWDTMPYAVVDHNLILSRLQHIYHEQPYARVDLMLQSGT